MRLAANEITAAYHDGLMAFRVVPPPIAAARLGADGPLLGAADEAFAKLLTDEGLREWGARKQAARQTGVGAGSGRCSTHDAPQPPRLQIVSARPPVSPDKGSPSRRSRDSAAVFT